MRSVDVAIVGGGVVGSATAYYLRKQGFAGSIAIIEKDTTYAFSCTARAAGGIRQQFSCPENILLSQFGLRLIRTLEQEFGAGADVAFREQGYLNLATAPGAAMLEMNAALQTSMGADIETLRGDALERRFPWIVCDDIVCGTFGRSGEGWLDPSSLMNLLRKAAQGLGAELLKDEVVAVEARETAIRSVTTRAGSIIACGALVNAAGASAGKIAAMAGIDLPVGPRKRYVYVLDCPAAPAAMHAGPLTIDPSGFYVRPEGALFISGLSPSPAEEPADVSWEVDDAWFEERIWPLLAHRIPAFETLKVVNSWVGHYDYNSFDENGIIGRHPMIENFYMANGFSGHGLQQAPAAGNAIAELIVHRRFRTIDLARLGYERIVHREPYVELNIV
ncbi:MAG: FAD-binding oxidoreductase [Pseudomonadota bacterium]|nr:FAD-binding oxidoreductase [Pseudomonadota bacterium]